ncbi:MAG: HD domain-containing protein [Deltaproteobacteria bacterium]|nr:MAG: HD domain-containing protein [Deltaproteobacteria bacterium]
MPGPAPQRPSAAATDEDAAWGAVVAALSGVGSAAALRGEGGRRVVAAIEDASEAARAQVADLLADAVRGTGAIVAIGALGRGEHVGGADRDLVAVMRSTHADAGGFEQGVRDLWDRGMRADLAVRTVEEWIDLAAGDLTAATAAFDASFCGGDREPFAKLRRAVEDAPWRRDIGGFLRRLRDEVEERHRRYGKTVYLTEPDLKHGAGGLRDLAVVRWALAAAHPPGPSATVAPSLSSLLEAAGIGEEAATALLAARRVLLSLRAGLAVATGRGGTRLAADVQMRLPEILGLVSASADDEERRRAAEDVMQAYFRAASDVLRYGRRAVDAVRPKGRRADVREVAPGFRVAGGRLVPTRPEDLRHDPVLALEGLAIAVREGVHPAGSMLDALAGLAADARVAFAGVPEVSRAFFDLLATVGDGRVSGLEIASDLGLLDRIVPAWAGMRGKLQLEGLHAYTADRHSIRAVEFLHALDRGEHDKSLPLATALWLSAGRRREILLAALLHDLGKAIDPARQAESGAPVAERAARDLGLGEAAARRVGFLVRHHATMPSMSQRRDLTDPAVVESLAATVADPDDLASLYLVSLADMSQVRPGYLTDWKRVLLDELYLRTLRQLVRRGRAPTVASAQDVAGLPSRYYDAYDPQMRVRHADAVEAIRRGRAEAVVEVEPGPGAFRMLVVTRDAPGLLARITEAFECFGVEVLAADVFVVPGEPKVALDVFRVRRRDGDGAGWSPEEIDGLARAIERTGRPAPPSRGRPGRTGRPLSTAGATTEPTVRFEDAPGHTIVEVRTPDEPGALRRIAYALFEQGISIHLARCSEDAGIADDVFYVDPIGPDERDHVARAIVWWLGA